jgi:hypothetical protein
VSRPEPAAPGSGAAVQAASAAPMSRHRSQVSPVFNFKTGKIFNREFTSPEPSLFSCQQFTPTPSGMSNRDQTKKIEQ